MAGEQLNEYMLNTLLEVSRIIISTLDIEKVDEVILKQAMQLFQKDYGALFILDEKSGHPALSAAGGFNEDELENLKILGAWEKINQVTLKSPTPLVVDDIAKNPEFNKENFPFLSFVSMRLEIEGKTVGILTLSNKSPMPSFDLAQHRILEILANYASIALVNAKLYKETEDLFISLISSLVAAIDAKDPYTAGHSQRVTKIALGIAEKMNLSRQSMKDLKLAAILHDIGKIGISELILVKPAALSPEEQKVIRRHPEIGVRIVSSIPHSERFIHGINEHHEFYNGEGYPRGLKKEEISLQGKIIAIADVFDALTSDRAYRKGMSLSEARDQIKNKSGIHLDPDLVRVFLLICKNKPDILFSKPR